MEGDILSRMVLNISDFKTKLNQVENMLHKTVSKIERSSVASSRKMGESVEDFAKRSKVAAGKYSRGWWDSFGRVALGFTIAYRAMLVFEAGLRKVVDITGAAIQESSELAATQAKLAFWYMMHTKETLTYAEAFERAAVNIHALGDASVYSVATLEELTTGIDELAQSVGAIPAEMIPAMASLVDFTVMVAQTTGSTTRQVRQEFQALMEGRIKTLDVMSRSLVKTGIMTRKDLHHMRQMQNQAEILEKVMSAVHEKWAVARDIYREASIEAAKGFWEKALKMNIRLSVELASELTKTGKVAGNLFAKVFVEHGKKALADIDKGLQNNVLTMMALRSILDKTLIAFEKTLEGISWFIAALCRMSDELVIAVKALGGLLIAGIITKLLSGLGKMIIWLALGPIRVFTSAVTLLNTAILRIPLLLYASVVAAQAFFKTMGMSGEYLKDLFMEIPKALKGIYSTLTSELGKLFSSMGDFIWDLLPAPIKKIINWIVEKIDEAATAIKDKAKEAADTIIPIIQNVGKKAAKVTGDLYEVLKTEGFDFAKKFGKNFKDTVLGHVKMLENLLAPVWSKLSGDGEENFKKMLDDAKKMIEGLGWQFKQGREETEKELRARLLKEQQILRLRLQMEKDFYIGRLAGVQANADAEYEIRVAEIEELARNKAEKDEFLALAAAAHAERVLVIHGTMTDGMKRGFAGYLDTVKTGFETTRDFLKQVLTNLESAIQTTMGDAFYDAFTGQLKSIQDYYRAFAKSFVRAWANMISQLIMELIKLKIMKSILGGVGGGTGGIVAAAVSHTGGIVGETPFPARIVSADLFSNAVRLHNGLAPDEFPAILQKGEVVIPKDATPALQSQSTQVDIVNVVDDAMFDRYLASARGQDAIVNVIGVRSQTLKRIIR